MRLLVGLGNPGSKYDNTRHNVGFAFLDYVAKRLEADDFKESSQHKALVAEARLGEEKLFLVKPTTFMNLSGQAVQSLLNYYKLKPDDVVIVYDDIDLPFGTIRMRQNGSAGTHNGMRSIIECLGTEEVPRLRLGVEGRTEEEKQQWSLRDYVLAKFTDAEQAEMQNILANGYQLLDFL